MEANAGNGGGSIREMAQAQSEGDEPEELFPTGVLEGDELSFLDLFKKGGRNVQVTTSIRAAEFPTSGGLLDPEQEGLALLTYRWTKPEPIPQWEKQAGTGEARQITGWKLRQIVEPIFIERLRGEAGAIEAQYAALLKEDPVAAGALLDRLKERAGEAITA